MTALRQRLKKSGFKWSDTAAGYLFILPVLTWISIFMAYPLYHIVYLSFFDWNLVDPNKTYIGFDNFAKMLHNEEFVASVWHTLHFTIGKVLLSIVAALLIALLINQKMRGVVLVRGFFYSPVVVSMIAAAMVWRFLFDSQIGPLTQLLEYFHIESPRWLDDTKWALNSIIIMSVWKNMGYYAVIYLAGLQGINHDYYEAASIDGATGFKKFLHITWPLLMPASMLVLIMSMIHAFQVFGQVFVMTAGGPVGSTSVIVYYLYKAAFEEFEIGYASAVGLFLFLFMLIFTLVQFKVMDRRISN